MSIDAWLPVGYALPSGERTRLVRQEDAGWQIYEQAGGGSILVAVDDLWSRWRVDGFVEDGQSAVFAFGGKALHAVACDGQYELSLLERCRAPETKSEIISFVHALRSSRNVSPGIGLQDAIYVEKMSVLLPTYTLSPQISDDIVFGRWITGGVEVSITSVRRIRSLVGWISTAQLHDVIEQTGLRAEWGDPENQKSESNRGKPQTKAPFALAGRPDLERFLSEHVVDIVENRDRYKALGIENPSAIILHGPPGCGKTFAVEKLIDYLGWPNWSIDASSIGSPYIHQTSKMVAEIFEKAIRSSPSVLVIDEMEAFLTDRQAGSASGQHRVEEVAEFLRRIPEAIKQGVLIIAMTNRIEMIDPAILRRGRFDHVIKVDMASELEVSALLNQLIAAVPHDQGIKTDALAKSLQGRPLSDVAFVVREAARLSVRAGGNQLTQASLDSALATSDARGEEKEKGAIGFIN